MSVVAIIPALNEEKTIGNIIDVLKEVDLINHIIVVSDGSIDNTVNNALEHGAYLLDLEEDINSINRIYVIDLEENIGKGGAMSIGVAKSDEDILLFLDADLIGLTIDHVKDLLKPVLDNKVDMAIGVFKHGKMNTDLAHKITPSLTGQRTLTRNLFNKLDNIGDSKFGAEKIITDYVKDNNISFETIELHNLTHVTKEKKHGFAKGVKSRFKMYYDIVKHIK